MDVKYKAVISGLGNIGCKFNKNDKNNSSNNHADSFLSNKDTDLIAGCSPCESDRNYFSNKFSLPAFATFETMLEETSPDIVSICSPTEAHFEQTAYCIKHHIPMVWLEKPPTSSTEQLKELTSLLQKHNGSTTILVNYHRRYTPCYQNLRTLFAQNTFGSCKHILIQYSRGLKINGSHLVDYLFALTGAETYSLDWVQANEPVNPDFTLTLQSGIRVIALGDDLPYHNIDISLVCERGRASILHGGITPHIEEVVEQEMHPGFYRLQPIVPTQLGPGGFDFSFDRALVDLITSHHTKSTPLSSIESSLRAQILIDSILKRASA